MNIMIRATTLGLAMGLMVIAPMGVQAEDPEPTPSPVPTKAPNRPKTLSDLAGGIKLQQPEGDKKEGVVIDNANLKAMGEGSVVSQGKSLGHNEPTGMISGNEGSQPAVEESPEMAALNRQIQRLQEQLKALDEASEERKKTNMYTGAGPQYRPPGVGDPVDTQRKRVEGELQATREKVKALERKEKRNRAHNPPAPSAPSGG